MINFQIGHADPNVKLDSLTVKAISRNPELIPNDNITIDTSEAPDCSLIITHNGEGSGEARVEVSVQDRFGVSTSVSFLVSVQDRSTN